MTLNCKILMGMLLMFIAGSISAQSMKGLSIESIVYLGKPIKHTPKLLFDVNKNTIGIDANIKIQTYGKKTWHQLQGYPLFGIAFGYFKIGEADVLGDGFFLTPNLTIYIFKKKKFDLNFQVGNGISYMTNPYDILENPKNNALGSHFNSTVILKFNLSARINPHWSVVASSGLSHASNGAAQLPNFGINIPAFGIGARYTPNPLNTEDYITHDISKKSAKKFGASFHAHLAYRESMVEGGPRYPVYAISAAAIYNLNKVNRAYLGIEYERNQSVYAFGQHIGEFTDLSDARKRSSRLMVFVADEFLFGSIGLNLQLGTYISPNAYLIPFAIYSKISTRIYLPAIGKPKTRFFLGVYLKAHRATAEYIAFGAGASF